MARAKMKSSEAQEAIPMRYASNYSVIQANELVRSRQDELTLLEAKLVRLAITQVLKDDTDLKTYTISISKLADYLNISSQNIYRDIQELSITLMKKSIFIKSKDGKNTSKPNYKIFHWVDFVEYKDGVITFKLSEHLKPYLVGLDELFTSYRYEEILRLPTNYAIRLYELLMSFANIQLQEIPYNFTYGNVPIEKDEAIFPIEYLREYFNCEAKYPNTGDFIKRVIASSIEDINKYTLLPCSYRTIRQRNKIAFIVFKISDWKSAAGQMIIENFLDAARNQKKDQ